MKIFIILMLVLALPLVHAQDLEVIKEVKTNFLYGEEVEVKINFNNPYKTTKIFEVKESLPQGFILINPKNADDVEYHDGITTEVFRWQITLNPGEIASISYKIIPEDLGNYGIKPTVILDKTNNQVYLSNSVEFTVSCDTNGVCEENENSLTCPDDCNAEAQDNICNPESEGICDPDCSDDPDCKNKSNIVLILLLLILILVIATVIFFFFKKKKQA